MDKNNPKQTNIENSITANNIKNKDQKKDSGKRNRIKPVYQIKTPEEFVDLGGDALLSQSEILDFSEGTDTY